MKVLSRFIKIKFMVQLIGRISILNWVVERFRGYDQSRFFVILFIGWIVGSLLRLLHNTDAFFLLVGDFFVAIKEFAWEIIHIF